MAYNPTTGVITDPDSIYDVQQALGESGGGDLMTLANSMHVKCLSKYKPIKDTLNGHSRTPQTLNDTDRMNRDWGFTFDTFPWTGGPAFDAQIKKIVDGSAIWPSFTAATEDRYLGNSWLYRQLVVDSNFARLTDFDDYNHKSENKYVDTTLTVLDDIKMVTSRTRTYTAKFFAQMFPYCPQNFISLNNYCMGIAIFSPTVNSGKVYFYVGTTVITASTSYSASELLMPSSMFNDLLGMIPQSVTEATFYAVGFFAPRSMAGKNNITDNNAYNELNTLIALPGLGYDTFMWKDAGGGGNLCLLTFEANPTSELRPTDTSFTAKILSVTNNYDIKTPPAANLILYPAYIYYTYDLIRSGQTTPDTTYSQTTRAQFGSSGSITISNTQEDGSGNVIHKTTDLTSYNISKNIPIVGGHQANLQSGDRIIVYLWYLTYNSVPGTSEDYQIASQFTVPIGTMPRE